MQRLNLLKYKLMQEYVRVNKLYRVIIFTYTVNLCLIIKKNNLNDERSKILYIILPFAESRRGWGECWAIFFRTLNIR